MASIVLLSGCSGVARPAARTITGARPAANGGSPAAVAQTIQTPSSGRSAERAEVARALATRIVDMDWLGRRVGWTLERTACPSGSVAVICQRVAVTGDGGRTWTRQPASPALDCAHRFSCGDKIVVASPIVGYVYGNDGATAVTTDGGRSWQRSAGPQVESMAVEGGTVYRLAFAHGGCPGPCHTFLQSAHPGGVWSTVHRWSWGFGQVSSQLLAGAGVLDAVSYGNPAAGAQDARATIWTTRDGGRTWTNRADPCGKTAGIEDDAVAADASGNALAVLCVPAVSQKPTFVEVSRDDGARFEDAGHPAISYGDQVAVNATGEIAVTGDDSVRRPDGWAEDYAVALTDDAGEHWRTTKNDVHPAVGGGGLDDQFGEPVLDFVTPTDVWWVGWPGQAWHSLDGGVSWTEVRVP